MKVYTENDAEILNEMDQMVYILDMDTCDLLFINKKGLDTLGISGSYQGRKCYELIEGRTSQCPFCKTKFLCKNGDRYSWEHYIKKLGRSYLLQDRSIVFNGRNAKIEIASDVSDYDKIEEDRYKRTLRELFSATPDAINVIHVNVTRNICSEGIIGDREDDRRDMSIDTMIRLVARSIPDKAERRKFQSYNRAFFLKAFEEGTTYLQDEYRLTDHEGKTRWMRSDIRMLRNPMTGDVEGVAYTSDISIEKRNNEILQIVTRRSFDLAALIHLDAGTFEAVYLGDSLPADYRKILPGYGAICRFESMCEEAARHMDEDTRRDYESRLSPDFMRSEIDKGGGVYEFTLKEYFNDYPGGFMYRKYLHFFVGEDRDTVLVVESDVTKEHMKQQTELEQARTAAERERHIMDSVHSGIAVLKMTDREHISVYYFNSYIFEMLGYDSESVPQRIEDAVGTPAESLFRDALSFVHHEDKEHVRNMFASHFNDSSFDIDPYRMQARDGSYRWISEKITMSIGEAGEHILYAAMNDVTDQMRMQNIITSQLKEEKILRRKADAANESKSDFLSRMSHDMRTPLNGIIGMTRIAQKEDNPPRTKDSLGKIATSSDFLLGLINDVLDMAYMESGKIKLRLEPYPFHEFEEYLDAVFRPLCSEKNIKFNLNANVYSDYIPICDRLRVNQILFNILSNAVKYTPEGGTVDYHVSDETLPDGRMQITHRISDSGIGMSSNMLEHLFEPFTQENRDDSSERRGSGLGLAIVKKLVDIMSGTISVESTLGAGTTFIIKLQLDYVSIENVDEMAELHAGNSNMTDSLAGKYVLLCEDHPLNQEIAKVFLEDKGMIVETADNGKLGVDKFRRSALDFYSIILMDIRMPVMDGYEATKQIRDSSRADADTVPIIAMTADAFVDDVEKCFEAGMNGHISKPVDQDKMLAVIAQTINNR